ncbi:MAG: hypothetical protein Q9M28_09490 [Mariprofundaceae bacterium]|nr:hypothetical protein [Mariprofundaceae bacterium]
MFDMLQVLSPLRNELKSKNYRRFSLIVVAVLSMVGISRWTNKGGSYRTVERFLNDDSIHWDILNYTISAPLFYATLTM